MRAADAKAAYETLVRQHAADLYRFAYRLVGDASGAEDLVQETYFHAWRSIGGLREPEKGKAWLMTILRRRWIRSMKASHPLATADDVDVDDTASPLPGPDLDLFARREAVQRALARLDVRYKEPFLLVFLEGLSCREAAGRLSLPLGTVLSRIHRARAALRAYLKETPESGRGDADARRASPGGGL
ncbi:MAG: RNA polymerase sigma factor [Planctomycetes bacterium]|nr:RNA polymerase sigma factor [Planctomycetota bacterium]